MIILVERRSMTYCMLEADVIVYIIASLMKFIRTAIPQNQAFLFPEMPEKRNLLRKPKYITALLNSVR